MMAEELLRQELELLQVLWLGQAPTGAGRNIHLSILLFQNTTVVQLSRQGRPALLLDKF